MPKIDVTSRFWKKVNKTENCWLWTASQNGWGYERFYVSSKVFKLAHRYSYEILMGPIKNGLDLDHLCRVRSCVNPAHLEPVTRKVNARRGSWGMKTHCPSGHPYSGTNLDVYRGGRRCKTCQLTHSKLQREKKGSVSCQ